MASSEGLLCSFDEVGNHAANSQTLKPMRTPCAVPCRSGRNCVWRRWVDAVFYIFDACSPARRAANGQNSCRRCHPTVSSAPNRKTPKTRNPSRTQPHGSGLWQHGARSGTRETNASPAEFGGGRVLSVGAVPLPPPGPPLPPPEVSGAAHGLPLRQNRCDRTPGCGGVWCVCFRVIRPRRPKLWFLAICEEAARGVQERSRRRSAGQQRPAASDSGAVSPADRPA